MARPARFDPSDVLDAAMHTFRRQGYQGASVKDLEAATGLRSGSLYHGFGDKAGLFCAAAEHYNRRVVAARLQRHLPPEAGLRGLRNLFRSLLREPDGGRSGCLLTNLAAELPTLPPEGARHIRAGLAQLQAGFAGALGDAVAAGELPRGADRPVEALQLLAFYQGLLVLVRAGYPDSQLQPLIDARFPLP